MGGDAVGQPARDGGIAGVADGVGEEVGEGGVVQQALGEQRAACDRIARGTRGSPGSGVAADD